MKTMNMTELRERHSRGLPSDELVLDVRDADEFAEGHVPGARNIPHEELLAGKPGIEKELGRYRAVYVHCGGGGRAGKAAAALDKAGLRNIVHIAASGMRSWIESKYPTEK